MLYLLQYSCTFSHVGHTGHLSCCVFCGLATHTAFSFLLLYLDTSIFGTQLPSIWNTVLLPLLFPAISPLLHLLLHIASLDLPILQTYFWGLVFPSLLQHCSCSYGPDAQTFYNWNTSFPFFLLVLSLYYEMVPRKETISHTFLNLVDNI